MAIADEIRHGWVERRHWDALAAELRLPAPFLARLPADLESAVRPAVRRVLAAEPFTQAERDFLATVADTIDRHADYLRATL
jgi:hypothetical protein